MEELVRSAEISRTKYLFSGYIHLKAIAGCSPELIKKAATLFDRLSANIELLRQADLDQLAPAKKHQFIESTMSVVKDAIDEKRDASTLLAEPA